MDGIQTKTACEQLHIDLNLDTQSVSQTILLYTAHVHCRKKLCQTFNVLEKFCIKLKLICKFTFFPKCLFSHCLGPIEKEEGNGKNRNSSWGAECMNVCAIADIYSCFWTKNIDGVSLSPKAWDNQCPGSNSQAEREREREVSLSSPFCPMKALKRLDNSYRHGEGNPLYSIYGRKCSPHPETPAWTHLRVTFTQISGALWTSQNGT